MSFAKYAQFYKDNGFFAGSKIKCTVTDTTFIGEELILSKDNEVIRSMTIPTSGKVEFFTDESGTLVLSADNGTSTLSGTVEITNYATYNVTLAGSATDRARYAYADDVEMSGDTAVANIAYTGDVSSVTAVNSDPSLVSLSIDGNEITFRDAGNDKSGKCSITATVTATSDYDSADVTFYVNKLTGTYGSWEDASDEMIASMIAKADAGEIDLADYWNIGDTRTVTLQECEAGETLITNQPEQEIDLVLMHYIQNNGKYVLKTPLSEGRKIHPSFVIGLKDCLANRTSISFIEKTYTQAGVTYPRNSISSTYRYTYLENEQTEVEKWLNENMYGSLPLYIQNALKETLVRFNALNAIQGNISDNYDVPYIKTERKTKAMKIVLPSIYEICEDNVTVNTVGSSITGKTIYESENECYYGGSLLSNCFDYSYEGDLFSFYENQENRIKHKNNKSSEAIPYLTRTFGHYHTAYHTLSDHDRFDTNAIVNESGEADKYNMDDTTAQYIQRGISPIMFI